MWRRGVTKGMLENGSITEASLTHVDMFDADVSLLEHLPISAPDEAIFQAPLHDIDWLHQEVTVYGRRHLQPRLTARYADPGKVFLFGGHDARGALDRFAELAAIGS